MIYFQDCFLTLSRSHFLPVKRACQTVKPSPFKPTNTTSDLVYIYLHSFSFTLEDGHTIWILGLLSLLAVSISSLTLSLPVHQSSYILTSMGHLLEGVLAFPLNCLAGWGCFWSFGSPVVNTGGSESAV